MKEKQTGRSDNGAVHETLGSAQTRSLFEKAKPKTFAATAQLRAAGE